MIKASLNFLIFACCCFLVLVGCQSPYQSPVAEIDEPRFLDSDRTHRVNAGETLYVIAWIYDLDFIQVARVNGLLSPYTIFPGQILNVDPRAEPAQQSRNVSNSSNNANTTSTASRNSGSSSRPVERTPNNAATTRPQNTVQVRPAVINQGPVSWAWPARGNVIGRFSESSVESKGINIAGSKGDTVMSAADGEVVYAGSGLLRYGELLIIKHNDRYLSAYAHNDRLVVNEGDKVTRGQKVAELGSTGVDVEMLHFEIRLEGKPVDPITYLPPRS